jgi:hypothetical protein
MKISNANMHFSNANMHFSNANLRFSNANLHFSIANLHFSNLMSPIFFCSYQLPPSSQNNQNDVFNTGIHKRKAEFDYADFDDFEQKPSKKARSGSIISGTLNVDEKETWRPW